jgi:hypothetical protein
MNEEISCRTWPPFYEKAINGVCVKVPPETPKYTPLESILSMALVVSVVLLPLYLITKLTK